jgi:Holliday junction DNA helicase RuvA
MIGELRGKLVRRGAGFIILNVGGVGYKIYVTAGAYQELEEGADVEFHTHLAVREDSLTLFGFTKADELRLFEMLISVSGIGPKSALAILSLTDAVTLSSAIANGESAYLTKVSGIGRKNAEKIILELKDKITGTVGEAREAFATADSEALEALEALGYSVRQAREALSAVPSGIADTGGRLKEALKQLGKS